VLADHVRSAQAIHSTMYDRKDCKYFAHILFQFAFASLSTKSGIRCEVAGARCQVSGVRRQVLGVTCQVLVVKGQVPGARCQV